MENSTKKTIFLLVVMALIATLALALVACNNKDEQTNPFTGGDNDVAHVHAYGEWAVVEPATHTKVGKQECRCECGATVQAEIPKLPDHEFVEWKTVTEPECMQDGLKESECACGEKRQERIPALGHKWDDGICTKCGEWQDLVKFKTLTFANYNNTASGKVANAVANFSFANELELSQNSAYVVSYDEHGNNKLNGDEVDLQEGNNTFYLTVTRGDDIEIITVSIYRNHMYSVRFDGIEEAQQVEEGHKAVAPQETPARTGYTFDGWDFDFDAEINSSQNVSAKWTANVYTVTLDVAGGDELEQTQFKVTYGESFSFPVATANLYRFTGWNYDEQQITQEDGGIYRWEIADDFTLRATYRFMLQLQDGVIVGADRDLPSKLVIPAKTMDGQDIVGIGAYAFGSDSLTSVTIPASITSIASNAFSGCTNLSAIKVDEHNEKYCDIDGIVFSKDEKEIIAVPYCVEKLTLSEGFEDLASEAVKNSQLTSIYIPSSVNVIDVNMFPATLQKFEISEDNKDYSVFSGVLYNKNQTIIVKAPKAIGEVTFPQSLQVIKEKAFEGCKNLTSVIIPSHITDIGSSAFNSCSGLQSVTIEKGVTSIGDYAFFGCTGLQTVTIDSGVTSIGDSAFEGCADLQAINMPDSVHSLGNNVFIGCIGLRTITIGENVSTIGYCAFAGCTGLSEISIPSSVQSIDFGVFWGCTGLQTVTIGENVQSISPATFMDCTNLETVTFSGESKLKEIENEAFQNCDHLKTITIPASVTSIGGSAFSGCTNLETVTFSGESKLKEIEDAFRNCRHLKTITIPASVTKIGSNAFEGCIRLKDVTFEDPTGWQYDSNGRQDIPEEQLRDHATAAELLTTAYVKYDWYRKTN